MAYFPKRVGFTTHYEPNPRDEDTEVQFWVANLNVAEAFYTATVLD